MVVGLATGMQRSPVRLRGSAAGLANLALALQFPVAHSALLTRRGSQLLPYLAFALTLWTGPVWTRDPLQLAVIWTAYCALGPRLEERRYLRRDPVAYQRYRESVPYWIPRRPSRAAMRQAPEARCAGAEPASCSAKPWVSR
jgi:hypothetical protein